jgi:ankyrin repeat protein
VILLPRVAGERKSTLGRDATIYAISFSPTGDLLATGGGDKQASMWSRHGRLLAESTPLDSAVKALAFSTGGTELACAAGKEVRLSTVVSDPVTGESRLKPHMNEEVSRIVNLPLLRATKEGDLDEIEQLLELGYVDVNFANQHGDTPLILACWYGHKYIAARLLDSGALLDLTNCDGNCALNVAAYRGNSEAVEMLLRHRATVDVPDHMTGKTALVKAAYVGHTPTAIALLDAKADVNAADTQGYTSLAFATSFNHEYMLQVLLHSDADPNTQDVFGITPLIHAAARGRLDTCQMLLQAGARPLVADLEGKTAIDYAESAQFPDVVSELRDAAKLMPQPVSPMPSMQSPFSDVPNTPRLTPRVPGKPDVNRAAAMLTPRVPSNTRGDSTARRLAAEAANGSPKSPSITAKQLTPVSTEKLSYLSKKLVHLSVMLEQDTVLSDTAYPTFHR